MPRAGDVRAVQPRPGLAIEPRQGVSRVHIPTPSEIAAKIREMGLEDEHHEQARAEAVKALLSEQALDPAPASGHVLARSTVAIADGYLEITITHYEGTAPV